KALLGNPETLDCLPAPAIRQRAAGNRQHVRIGQRVERSPRHDAVTVPVAALLAGFVVDETGKRVRVTEAVEGLETVAVAGEDQQRARRRTGHTATRTTCRFPPPPRGEPSPS